jgi:hypothetical protein
MSLTQYAQQLKEHSLRCSHDPENVALNPARKDTEPFEHSGEVNSDVSRPRLLTLPVVDASRTAPIRGLYASAGVGSKSSSCARDLIGPCRRCGVIVCRNCVIKPPSNIRLKERVRRLCNTCLDAPIEAHLHELHNGEECPNEQLVASSSSSTRSARSLSGCSTSNESVMDEISLERFTTPAFLRGPCICESRGVYLCAPCGGMLRAQDTTYQRVFSWRSRYSMGGIGNGLGLGNQGQKCGRGAWCLDSTPEAVCWVEVDCSDGTANDGGEHDAFGLSLSRVSTPDSSSASKPGYLQQEVVSNFIRNEHLGNLI